MVNTIFYEISVYKVIPLKYIFKREALESLRQLYFVIVRMVFEFNFSF